MEKPKSLFDKYPIGYEFNLILRDGDGPYHVKVVDHYKKINYPPDNGYHIGEKPHKIKGLQIKFLGKIPSLYYCPGFDGLHKDAHNYVVWDKGMDKKKTSKEGRKMGLYKSGFVFSIRGYRSKPPKPYYKITKLRDREDKEKKDKTKYRYKHSSSD